MDKTALNRRIIQLLEKHEGDFTAAQTELIALSAKDHDILLALSLPHLSGITAHAIHAVATRLQSGEITKTGKTKLRAPSPLENADKNQIGFEMLKSMAVGKPAKFGLEKQESLGEPTAASAKHIAAIHQIAKPAPKDTKRR